MDKRYTFLFLLGCLLFAIKIDAKEQETPDECRFLNCPSKPFHLKEGQPPVGIFQIQAECKNKTRDLIYRIFYNKESDRSPWIVNDFLKFNKKTWEHNAIESTDRILLNMHPIWDKQQFFSVDKKTGWVNSTNPLYWRDIDHKRYVDVTVVVEGVEKGLKVLKSCSFEIYLDGENKNNAPSASFRLGPIDLDSSSRLFIVHRVGAYDGDLGDNGRLKFSMRPKTGNASNWPFEIDENTGIIFVNKNLRRAEKKEYDFVITVSDRGSPPLSTETERSFRII